MAVSAVGTKIANVRPPMESLRSNEADRITILHIVAPAEVGGAERVVQALAGGHSRAGHSVHVAAVLSSADRDHAARDTTRPLACLRPDVEAGDEQILTSLAQFDFLTCLAAMAASDNEVFGGVFYPSFAWVRSARTQPIAERLLREPALAP